MGIQVNLIFQIRDLVFPNVMPNQSHGHNQRDQTTSIALDQFRKLRPVVVISSRKRYQSEHAQVSPFCAANAGSRQRLN